MNILKRIFFRPRSKIVLFLSAFLLFLCFITVMFPSTIVLQRSFETESILLESRRSEYYILNKDFFEFLARTNMECLIQIEPGEEWNVKATVKTRLSESVASNDPDYNEESKEYWSNTNKNVNTADELPPVRYILAYRHFEQLGKTTENLLQLAAVARRWKRYVVKPDVQNSRFSLEPGFRSQPLNVYFNVSNMNRLLYQNGYSKLIGLGSFLRDCNYAKTSEKTTVVHFLYNDVHLGNTRKWFHLKTTQLQYILDNSISTGWAECPFIEEHLELTKSLDGVRVGRQLCVNPEVIMNEASLEESVLRGDKCVAFVEWRGFGRSRIHFSPSYWPFLTPREMKHNIAPSHLIDREVIHFKRSKLASSYISVHLRTERLLSGNSFKKLQLCIEHVVHIVGILQALRGVDSVFLATDMTPFGSDAFDRRTIYTSNSSGSYLVQRDDLARIHSDAARRLNAVTYKPRREPFTSDKGIVSLVEMNILKGGVDLVSVGSGTFHAWLVSVFRQHQSKHREHRGYTISEICNDGSK